MVHTLVLRGICKTVSIGPTMVAPECFEGASAPEILVEASRR